MGPSNFLINYDWSMSSTSIPRKPKRYLKSSIAAMKYPQHKKGCMSSTCYFQKKRLLSSALCQLNQNLLQGLKS